MLWFLYFIKKIFIYIERFFFSNIQCHGNFLKMPYKRFKLKRKIKLREKMDGLEVKMISF